MKSQSLRTDQGKSNSSSSKSQPVSESDVERAMASWLEAARETGKLIPALRYRPLIYQVGTK